MRLSKNARRSGGTASDPLVEFVSVNATWLPGRVILLIYEC